MNTKEQDKEEIQAAKNNFRTQVGDSSLSEPEKWRTIRQAIKRFREDATAVLLHEKSGVVAHDRRAKLAAFACEYAIVYYENVARDSQQRSTEEEPAQKLGDLARYLSGIKSVPRAAPQLNSCEKAAREHWTKIALMHYGDMRGPLRIYTDRIERLLNERQEHAVLVPFLFTARKAIEDSYRGPRDSTLTLDAIVRGLAQLGGLYGLFTHVATETMQAFASGSPLQLSHTAHAQLLKIWNEPQSTASLDEAVSVTIALVLLAFYTQRAVVNVKQLYQQLLRSERLHGALLATFVNVDAPPTLTPLLRNFIETTMLNGHPLADKVRALASYPARF